MSGKSIRWISAFVYGTVMIVGWWYPVVALAAFLLMGLALLTGKRKKWCGSYCPRGSFLDLVMKRISPKKPVPRWMTGKRIWYISISVFLFMFGFQIIVSGLLESFSWKLMGTVAYRMCFVTSMVALPLALWRNHRAWCSICPVGNLLRR